MSDRYSRPSGVGRLVPAPSADPPRPGAAKAKRRWRQVHRVNLALLVVLVLFSSFFVVRYLREPEEIQSLKEALHLSPPKRQKPNAFVR